ncbi:MAG: cyclic pyranopterin monophosphate synthase MoaC [Treponemataceae bacterium]
MNLTHINEQGHAKMVDVSEKNHTERSAVAFARIQMKPETLKYITEGKIKKGDVLAVAQVAGIMAVKNTSAVIPMCHPLPIAAVDIRFEINKEKSSIEIFCTAKVSSQTGIEMEALHGASICALTIYDMCKAIDKEMIIEQICLLEKKGGKTYFTRNGNL